MMSACGRRAMACTKGMLATVSLLILGVLPASGAAPQDRALRGERLIRDLNCGACHQLGASLKGPFAEAALVGPDLREEGAKVQPEWLFDFLKDPRPLRPGVQARMPKFRFSDEDALSITLFLSSLRPAGSPNPVASRRPQPAPKEADLQEGKRLFGELECAKCHFPPGHKPAGKVSTDELGPDLGLARLRLRSDWVLRWLKEPQAVQPGTKMPNFFFDNGEPMDKDAEKMALRVRDYVMNTGGGKHSANFRNTLRRFPEATAERGRNLVEALNCAGCHRLKDVPKSKKVGPPLVFEGDRVRHGWLVRFLRNPDVIRPTNLAVMPDFRLSDEEASAVAAFIAGRWTDKGESAAEGLDAKKFTPAMVAAGKRLWERELGCSACHRVGERGSIGAPVLTGAKDRLTAPWLFRWIMDPKHYIPDTPMPRVPLSAEEAKSLTAYLFLGEHLKKK